MAGAGGSDPTGGIGGSNTAGSDTGGMPPVMVCNPKATQCSKSSFQTCKDDGTAWDSEKCDFVCDAKKGCVGACNPGTKQCNGKNSQSCDETGKWVTTNTCPFACSGDGACTGVCVRDAKQCDGDKPQTCNVDGEWDTDTACPVSCSGGACVTSECTPGDKECNGIKSRTCQANGTWKETSCTFICQGVGICAGSCHPGEHRCSTVGEFIETCDSQGQWQTDASCPFVCIGAGTCGGACKPNYACENDGNECTNDVCAPDGLSCGHANKADSSPCGSAVNSECNKPDSCQAGQCKQNFVAGNVACSDDGNTCTSDLCNGAGFCGHVAAPPATVCRVGGCSNGVLSAQATCGGSTTCPASTTSECFGACNAQANACLTPAPTKIDEVYNTLATDNDVSFLYASTRSQAGVSQVVRYSKNDGTKTVLFESGNSGEWIYALTVVGGYVYFGETFWSGSNTTPDSGQVSKITTNGVKQTASFVQAVSTFGFAKNTSNVYWTDGGRDACFCQSPPVHHVYTTVIGGTSPSQVGPNFSNTEVIPDIEVTDTDLYIWTAMPPASPGVYNPVLSRYSLAGVFQTDLIGGFYLKNGSTSVETRYSGVAGASPGLTKNGSFVFANTFTDIGGTGNSNATAIFSFKIADDTKKLLAVADSSNFPQGDINPSWNFVADSAYVYYDNKRVAVGGGSLTYWINHQLATLSTLTLDANNMYFGSYGYWTAQPFGGPLNVQKNAIYKVVKQ